MASASGKKNTSAKRRNTKKKSADVKRRAAADSALYHEIGLIVLFVVMVLLFCCNFGLIGPVGNAISGFMFGLFGLEAYIVPVLLFIAVAFMLANAGSPTALRKLLCGILLFLVIGIFCQLLSKNAATLLQYNAASLYAFSKEGKNGGGILAGSIAYVMKQNLGTMGTVLICLLLGAISLILMTEKSFLALLENGKERLLERSEEEEEYRKEYAQARALEKEALRSERQAKREEEARVRSEEAAARAAARNEEAKRRAQEAQDRAAKRAKEKALREEAAENDRILRMEKKTSGVTFDTTLKSSETHQVTGYGDMREITYEEEDAILEAPEADFAVAKKTETRSHAVTLTAVPEDVEELTFTEEDWSAAGQNNAANANYSSAYAANAANANYGSAYEQELSAYAQPQVSLEEEKEFVPPENFDPYLRKGELSETFKRPVTNYADPTYNNIHVHKDGLSDGAKTGDHAGEYTRPVANLNAQAPKPAPVKPAIPKRYAFPPMNCLTKPRVVSVDTTMELKETALRLQETLHTFGVNVTVTDISQGPSVTRYELQPEQGVKVSKIVGLSDDIKMHLAATDIRIEAPIPGKAAVGIEVPNKEIMTVSFRELIESKEFKDFPSKIGFAVGKDIGGKVVVADIAKMPHMLIAGATGSGKSVCINTLIMSILYKAHPEDVKLIMIDPKVVELSVYNGIPHLLIPVVTDPKKASAALHWAVTEMEERYRKFAEYNVRDLKGYNAKVESEQALGEENAPKKLPQIVIIVDELADLMMVCASEVEESICRLAQLARACGIHLIIATQRPSVDVITGLIKANMPSRVAFSVSSGTDSRTILDMIGAEKLLGKGDMLFYPQGYTKPARVQGAFVSDEEVGSVVDFLKGQLNGSAYAADVEAKIAGLSAGAGGGAGKGGAFEAEDTSGRDELFAEAGRIIIANDKASSGMLQRILKIGFNRAARIMDELADYGVVGKAEGTKARQILMNMEQFEQLLDEL